MARTNDDIPAFRAMVPTRTDSDLHDMLGWPLEEWQWNAVADEINRRNAARRAARVSHARVVM